MIKIVYIIVTIVLLLILITIHELGHFIAGKIFKFKINEFSIGFGPAIISKKGKKTKFSVRAIPLGGYCAFENNDASSEENAEPVDPKDCFDNQKPWKRLIVLVSGPLMNFITAFIFCFVFLWASGFGIPVVQSVMTNGENVPYNDFQVGDRIVAVNYVDIDLNHSFSDLISEVQENSTVVFSVVGEDGTSKNVSVTKQLIEGENPYYGYGMTLLYERKPASFSEAFVNTPSKTIQMTGAIIDSFGKLFTNQVSIKDVSGPIGTINYITEYTQKDLMYVLLFLPLLSLNLAVFNILPFPALDGGKSVFVLIEMIFKKRVNKNVENYIHTFGLLFLLLFLLLVDVINSIISIL